MDNTLKKLSRLEILELMLAQSERLEKVERQLEARDQELAGYKEMISNLQNTLSANVLLLKEQETRIVSLRKELADIAEENKSLLNENVSLKANEASTLTALSIDEASKNRFEELEAELEQYRLEMEAKTNKRCEQMISDTEHLCQFRIVDKNPDLMRFARLILDNEERFAGLFNSK